MKTYIDGEYKVTELDSGHIIREINQDGKIQPTPVKPGASLNLTALNGTATGKALLVLLKHFNLV
jgi:hypothetical protein